MSSLPPTSFGEDDVGLRHHAYSRKQKSLGLLCTNFINLYNKDGVDTVGLDEAASRLGVERRRIYDIVNVLESVGVLTRKAKNRYSWIGFVGIPKSLEDLKEEGLREISNNPGVNPFAYYKFVEDDDDDEKTFDQDGDSRDDGLISSAKGSSSSAMSFKKKAGTESRREKSLGQLTQNFVKLFLTSEDKTISLDEAAGLLLCDGFDSNQMRTKVRRLYDIANVLSSLNLIEKTQHSVSRKPAFKWLGVDGKRDGGSSLTVAPPSTTKQWNKRTFGNDITNLQCKKPKLSVAIEKPRKYIARSSDDIRECNLTAQRQLQGPSKVFSFGPFQPSGELKNQRHAEEKADSKSHDWEALASSFRIQYHNQALSELFSHYMEAWKSWYIEVAHGKNSLGSYETIKEQPL